jgi:Ran GTPase-activating protein (RanGAP) involved in mRNA processing and transport
MRLRKLERLELEWCSISQKCVDFIAENLNELKVINLNYCPGLYDEAVLSLARRAVKLRKICLGSLVLMQLPATKLVLKGFCECSRR